MMAKTNRRKKHIAVTPIYLQMEASECGAVALRIVLAYYGRFIPGYSLRRACKVSRDGCRIFDLKRAAMEHGLEVKVLKLDIDQLDRVPWPAICYLKTGHFVVLDGCSASHIHINDPKHGPQNVLREEFRKEYGDVVFLAAPSPEFQRTGRRYLGSLALIRRFVGSYRRELLLILVATIQLAMLGFLMPGYFMFYVDQVLPNDQGQGLLRGLIVFLMGVVLVKSLVCITQLSAQTELQRVASYEESAGVMQHLLHLPLSFFYQRWSGEIQTRVNSSTRLVNLLSGDLVGGGVNAIMLVTYTAVLILFSPILALLGAFGVAFDVAFVRWAGHRQADLARQSTQEWARVSSLSVAHINNIEHLKTGGGKDLCLQEWGAACSQAVEAGILQSRFGLITTLISSLLTTGIGTLCLVLGAHHVSIGIMTIGALVTFQGLLNGVLSPIREVSQLRNKIRETHATLERVEDIVMEPVEKQLMQDPQQGLLSLQRGEATSLTLHGVSYSYNASGSSTVLHSCDLTIRASELIALTGPSGSGKSTLARIAAGIYPPAQGVVMVNGFDRRQYLRTDLAAQIGYIDQDIHFTSDTVRNNLTIGSAGISQSDLIAACKDAMIYEQIMSWRDGFESLLDDNGYRMSGGERQRLDLARVLCRRPSLLILDEATGALDTDLELQVLQNIRKRGCAVLLVTHRLSAMALCDRVYAVMGRVVRQCSRS